MTTRQFTSSRGNTWEWEETPELIAAVKQLGKSTQDTAHKLAELKLKRPHERQINNG